jgi:hypothetical protein
MTNQNAQPAQLSVDLPDSRRGFIAKAVIAGAVAGASPFANAVMEVWREGDPRCRVLVSAITPDKSLGDWLGDFMNASRTLTGEDNLDEVLGYSLMYRFASNPLLTASLIPMLRSYRDLSNAGQESTAVGEKLMDPKGPYRVPAEQLIYLWYFSAFFLPADNSPGKQASWIYGQEKRTEMQYAKGLLWSITGSHAPMTAGGTPGYWSSKPGNA